jgi:hypothetical protein
VGLQAVWVTEVVAAEVAGRGGGDFEELVACGMRSSRG